MYLHALGSIMDTKGKNVSNSIIHQPSKAELEENVRIGAMPKALAWTLIQGAPERRMPKDPRKLDA